MKSKRTRLLNVFNRHQGDYKRVLCVCSAGILRSATAAWLLSNAPYNYNTRACGIEEYALIPLDECLVTWAEEIVCMTRDQARRIESEYKPKATVYVLDIPDAFGYRDPELVSLFKERYDRVRK